jgi:hypothetical protein
MQYFTPADVKHFNATYNYTARAGMGFAITPENEQVFVAARDVEQLNLQVGDALRVWATDNSTSPQTAHYPSRWRAVRVEVAARIGDVSTPPNATETTAAPAPITPTTKPTYSRPRLHASDFSGVMDTLMAERQPWSVNELTHAIANESLALSGIPDLIQRVSGRLTTQHKNGEVACLKVYARGDQQAASAVYYAKDVDVFYDHLDAPLNDEE